MVLDKSVEEIIRCIGHDGSDIFWPNQPEPKKRRGFGYTELTTVAYKFGYVFVPFMFPDQYWSTSDEKPVEYYPPMSFENHLFENHDAVLIGTPNDTTHAVAWDHVSKVIYDPNGHQYSRNQFKTNVFWMVQRMQYASYRCC